MASDYNFTAVVVGPPQYGKTTIVRGLVVEHLRTYPTGLVIAQDPNRQFRDICASYDDVAAFRAAAAKAQKDKAPFPRGAGIGGSTTSLRELAVEIGKRHNTAGNVRVPVLLVYDETSLMDSGSGSSYMDPADVAVLSNRRHWGVGMSFNMQRAAALHDGFYAMATDLYILGLPSEKESAKVEERAGLKPGSLASLVGAPPFKYAHWRAGRGLV